jgi:hypothetical protein
VYVSAATQEFKGGVGVTQGIQGSVLPILVLQQARVTHQPPKYAVQAWRFLQVVIVVFSFQFFFCKKLIVNSTLNYLISLS